jgi:predicted nucleic acid-binding protein
MTTFLDTNVIIYLLEPTSPFHNWAKTVVGKSRTAGPLLISDVVYSEFSVTLDSVQDTDQALDQLGIERVQFSTRALFLAGRAFVKYRKGGGTKTSVLSDFLIGAQAETEGAPLITNDRHYFSSYFPAIQLILP